MSSTTNLDHTHDTALRRVLSALFIVSVIVFLLGGLAIVVGQALQLALGNASGARAWEDHLAVIAFGGASVAGLLAFLLTYGQHDDDEEAVTDDPSQHEVEGVASHPRTGGSGA